MCVCVCVCVCGWGVAKADARRIHSAKGAYRVNVGGGGEVGRALAGGRGNEKGDPHQRQKGNGLLHKVAHGAVGAQHRGVGGVVVPGGKGQRRLSGRWVKQPAHACHAAEASRLACVERL